MKCPVCKSEYLKDDRLDEGLPVSTCPACGGHFVQSLLYWRWRDARNRGEPERPEGDTAPLEVVDSPRAKLCPECGRLMTRYKVGHGLPFRLDQCAACDGVWFDRHEWEVLRSRNLHDDAHLVFSRAWQYQVRLAENAEAEERTLREKFGDAELAELRRLRSWIDAHPRCPEVRAFLLGDAKKVAAPAGEAVRVVERAVRGGAPSRTL